MRKIGVVRLSSSREANNGSYYNPIGDNLSEKIQGFH